MATNWLQKSTTLPLVDSLLKDIARRIQLSPTSYELAIKRYDVMRQWLERPDSVMREYFTRLYPQGSMAIGGTIASKLKNDEFDIDVIAELNISADSPPGVVLDTLFNAVNGGEGSRYHGKVTRRTRCVTVEYQDMHLDITPAVLLPNRDERTSIIFHAHEDEPATMHRHIIANPWGFADWFEDSTPAVREIMEATLFKAAADPVPDQTDLIEKSMPLIALQLLKRWRNKCYDLRQGRCPPSIVIAYYVAMNARPGRDLFSELREQTWGLLREFGAADQEERLVRVENPRCKTDVLTDRWPGDVATQRVFLNDLRRLDAELQKIVADPTVEMCSEVFSRLFGENVTRVVVEDFSKAYAVRASSGGLFTAAGSGGVALGASGLGSRAAAERAIPIPRHKDFGADV